MAGANVNVTTKDGLTALMLASAQGNTEIVKILLLAKPHLNMRQQNGYTALQIAKAYNHPDIVKILQQAGAR